MAEESPPQQLTVILDTNPTAWEGVTWTLDRTTEAVLAFLNAFAMLHSRNQLAVFASHLTKRQHSRSARVACISPSESHTSFVLWQSHPIPSNAGDLSGDRPPSPRHERLRWGQSTGGRATGSAA